MRIITSIVLSLFCSSLIVLGQNPQSEDYYHNKVSSNISVGKELINEGEDKEGVRYLKEAILIAEERDNDYALTTILVSQLAFDPIVNYYYRADSTAQARHYLEVYEKLLIRYADAAKNSGELTDEQYAVLLMNIYGAIQGLPRNNNDYEYAIKYGKKYIETARSYNRAIDEYNYMLDALMWEYRDSAQYLEALIHSIDAYKDKKRAGVEDEEALRMARFAYVLISAASAKDHTLVQTAREACNIWINFLTPLYAEKGESHMNSVLMKLDKRESLWDEIIMDGFSTTLMAAKMQECIYAIELEGYDVARNTLFGFREYLYKTNHSELWPIASLRFIHSLEDSSKYGFCKSVEQDFLSLGDISNKDVLHFYVFYLGACNRVGDLKKAIEITDRFALVKETDEYYWFICLLRSMFYLNLNIGLYEEGLSCAIDALNHYKWPDEQSYEKVSFYLTIKTIVGRAFRLTGETDKAIEYCTEVLSEYDSLGLPRKKNSALIELGCAYLEKGNLEGARDCFISSLKTQSVNERGYGTAVPFSYLFDIERRSGKIERARQYLYESWMQQLKQFLDFREFLTVQEQTQFWTTHVDIRRIGGLIAASSPGFNDIFYDMLLASKGFLLRAEAAEYNNVFSSGDTQLIELYRATHDREGFNLTQREQYMARYRIHNFKTELEKVSWRTVQSVLSKRDLAVEFFQYKAEDEKLGIQYGAMVLKDGWPYPKFVHLCSSSDLEQLAKEKHHSYDEKCLLYKLIWEPLSNEFKGIDNIYYSPQGLLHTLNLSAIIDDNGTPLFYNYNMYMVSSTANIARIIDRTVEKAYVYGGLVYDSDNDTMLQEHRKISRTVETGIDYSWVADSSSARHGWTYLPNTQAEVDNITNLLSASEIKVVSYCGVEGTEESFKALDGTQPGLLHMATHGFYLPYSFAERTNLGIDHEKLIAATPNALVRSGLILSSGGRAWKGESIPQGVEAGILQADEIAGINLSGTSLLVLSACETALGDISSDGVYGLQRAFKMAGVETIIMSLWEVDDRVTSLFMSYFYEAWTSGKTKHAAFVSAQIELIKKYPNPYYWAAFIMLD